jgi:hypothetical protein
MKRCAFALVLAGCIAATLQAQTTTMSFAGLKWGSTRESVKQSLSPLGYAFTKLDEDGDLDYTGELVGYPATMFFFFTPNDALVMVEIHIRTPNNKTRETYKEMKETLTEKYGQPSDDFHFFQPPYFEGDGYEDQAFRLGKATFPSFWKHPGKTGNEMASLEITPALNLEVGYEAPGWHEELIRRKAKLTKVF